MVGAGGSVPLPCGALRGRAAVLTGKVAGPIFGSMARRKQKVIRLAARRRARERAARRAPDWLLGEEPEELAVAEVIELVPAAGPGRVAGGGEAGEVLALPVTAEAQLRADRREWYDKALALAGLAQILERRSWHLPREELAVAQRVQDGDEMLPASDILAHISYRIWRELEPGP